MIVSRHSLQPPYLIILECSAGRAPDQLSVQSPSRAVNCANSRPDAQGGVRVAQEGINFVKGRVCSQYRARKMLVLPTRSIRVERPGASQRGVHRVRTGARAMEMLGRNSRQ